MRAGDNVEIGALHAGFDRPVVRRQFVGRQKESRRLFDAVAPVLSGRGSRAVLIVARTGGGKTAFVKHLTPTLESRGAVVALGKFDQVVRDTPYAALVDALRAWLRRASMQGPREFERVRDALQQRLGASARVLTGLLPELALFLGHLSATPTLAIQEDRNRFQFAVLALLRAMTDGGRACLLFLDDLQWADEATLNLIVRICLDSDLPRVGFLLTHRDDDEYALARTSLAFHPLGGGPPVLTRIVIPALSAGDIAAMVDSSRHGPRGPDAARALLARTGGNPLFVTELLRCESLSCSLFSPDGASDAGEEIAGLLLRRLRTLAPDRQALLGAGAFMGARIDSAILAQVLDRDESSVRSVLESAACDAILVREDGRYRFGHDRLQEAALDLIPTSHRPSLHARLGQLLGERAVRGDAAVAFDAAYHMHLATTGGDRREHERLLGARVNLLCARRARLAAAERSAFVHAFRGCDLLGETGWDTAYELTLDLHTEAACAAFAVGETEAFSRLAQRVREHARSAVDELPIQEVLVIALTGSSDVPAAFDLVCDGARKLGVGLPREPGAEDVVTADRRIERALATMTPEWIKTAKRVDDPSVVVLLRLLGLGNAAAYTARPRFLRMLVGLELDLSARHGFSDVTALALAFCGALDCASLNTMRRGIRIRASALEAAKRVSDGATLARTLDIVHGMTSTWTGPLRDAVAPLLENARLGLEHGTFDYAGYSALKGCFFALLSGTPLDEIASRLDAWRCTFDELGQFLAHAYLSRDRQVVERLRRRADTHTSVTAELDDEAVCWRSYDALDDHYGGLYLAVGRLLLAAVLVDPASAFEASDRLARHAEGGCGLPHYEFGRFYAAVCMWDAAYAGLMERADAMARVAEILAEITKCSELVPANFAHKSWLLHALLADLRGDMSEALEMFDRALEGAWSSGYVHEAGLAGDRASRVCARVGLWEKGDAYRARAEEAWTVWGARARTSSRAGSDTLVPGALPTQREVEAVTSATDESHAVASLMQSVPRWLGAPRAWLVRVGDELEIVASAEEDRACCHLESPRPLGSVPLLDRAVIARAATAAATHAPPSFSPATGGLCLLPLVFQARTHGVLALNLPPTPEVAPPAGLMAATFACAHVAAVIDAARFQASLSRQARERDRAEEALRKNTALLQNIVDATQVVIYVKGVDGHYMLANRVFKALFDADAVVLDKTDFDIFPREVAQLMQTNDLEVLRSREPLERLEVVPVRGESRTYLSVKVPLLSEDGTPFAVCGLSTDITELRRTEDALRESEQRLMLAAVSAKLGIWDLDIQNNRMTWDDRMFCLYGIDEKPAAYDVGIWRKNMHPDDAARTWEEYEAALRGERSFDTEFRVRHPDGTVKFIKADGLVIRNADGEPVRMIGINRDITEKRQLEERRRRLAERVEEEQHWLEAVLDRTPIPLVLAERESGRVAFANRAANAMAGGTFPRALTREEGASQDYHVTDEHDHELPVDQWPAARAARGEKVEAQMIVLHTPAGRFPMLASGETLPPTRDHPATFVLALQDVSELVRAIRARDEFLSIASHELKTPLTSLKLQVQLRERALAKGAPLPGFTPEALVRTLANDVRQVDRLTRLVDDILDVSRISSGRFSLAIGEPVDLVALVRDVLERSSAALDAALCSVTVDTPATVAGLWDRGRIEQVVLNLLTNAWKYGRGKPIHVSVRAFEDRAVVAVRDEGVGVSPVDQKRIFQVFERAISKNEVSGLGLGLYIAHRIVEAHGGAIRVDSELGKGATFTVELPLEAKVGGGGR